MHQHDHSHDHDQGHCDHAHCQHHHAHGPKHIYVYSPSGAVRDKKAFQRAVKRLEAMGHQVEVDQDALASSTRFAGDDDTRLAAIARACESGADVAMISRGGYGLSRLLHRLDYEQIAKAVASGTRFVGLSDFTAFQLALYAKTRAMTWAGPALVGDFGAKDGVDDIMQDCFEDLLSGAGEGAGWRLTAEKTGTVTGASASADVYIPKATLWGGNLAMIASLVGSPYLPKVKGGVLFIEDVGETPYKIERMLTTLLHAGVLAQQKAVVFGQFSDYQLNAHDKGFKLASVVQWLRTQIEAPVFTNLPFGHVPTKVLLPVGAQVSLSVEGRDALIYWGHQ
ncbi:LD-carboxypeptidase [Comamonas sp. JNW]|jgi:muramoyltetrapeptide carboxypeptidase|uniref:LD-carboxypeptidase n=1 Tax=unclassified Comamonas TaxID=2638500 RepID=UPI000DE64293|nr:LD-carboxypeptidase [Comamonas sp. JNW]PWB18976.1 LD-carboxypeptidase [Comamonas sp. JNW]